MAWKPYASLICARTVFSGRRAYISEMRGRCRSHSSVVGGGGIILDNAASSLDHELSWSTDTRLETSFGWYGHSDFWLESPFVLSRWMTGARATHNACKGPGNQDLGSRDGKKNRAATSSRVKPRETDRGSRKRARGGGDEGIGSEISTVDAAVDMGQAELAHFSQRCVARKPVRLAGLVQVREGRRCSVRPGSAVVQSQPALGGAAPRLGTNHQKVPCMKLWGTNAPDGPTSGGSRRGRTVRLRCVRCWRTILSGLPKCLFEATALGNPGTLERKATSGRHLCTLAHLRYHLSRLMH